MRIKIEEEMPKATFAITNLIEDYSFQGSETQVVSKVTFPQYKPLKGYLIIAVSSNDKVNDIIKWKVTLNNIALTREFRPHIDAKIDERTYQAIFAYEVSKILTSTDLTLKISYEGKDKIKIDAASLITLHQYDDDEVYVLCISEVVQLNNYEIVLPTINNKNYRESTMYIGIIAQKRSVLRIDANNDHNNSSTFTLREGFNLIEANLNRYRTSDKVVLKCDDTSARHLFRCITHSSIIYPDLDIKHQRLDKNNVDLIIKNIGFSKTDHTELIILKGGIPTEKFIIGSMEPDEERKIRLLVSNNISKRMTIRVIWRKALRTFVKDHQIT
ncbi:MAG: hypothetical protein QXT53_03940 [Ignisphaera sp.]